MQVYGSIIPGAETLGRLLPKQVAEGRAERGLARGEAQAEAMLSHDGKRRLQVIRWHAEHGSNVSRTAAHSGYSRPTIHAWLKRYQRAGPKGPRGRQPPAAARAQANLVRRPGAAGAGAPRAVPALG